MSKHIRPKNLQVILGKTSQSEMKLLVKNVVTHPQYSAQDKLNDIALIELTDHVNLSSNMTLIPFFHSSNQFTQFRYHPNHQYSTSVC